MFIHIYLDHNILDEISKVRLNLKPSSEVVWVYSNESFSEIKRSGDRRFLDVLDSIQARKLEIALDSEFRITGRAQVLEYRSAHEAYESYLDANEGFETDERSDHEVMARLFGAENKTQIISHPEVFEKNIKALLEPLGLYNETMKEKVKQVRNMLDDFVKGPLQDVGKLEDTRHALGSGRGRAGNLAEKDNPVQELWKLISKGVGDITEDQYFGFDPVDKQGYQEWPMFLGIVGCYTVLNHLGFRPDEGLAKPESIPGILSDASHVAHAAYCHGLLSRDRRLLMKARAIYRYKNIGTQVLTISNSRQE